MTHKLISKVNATPKFLHRKNENLTPNLCRLLFNVSIEPHFDYTCSAWYPNLSIKLKNKNKTSQNKCICFCLQLDKMVHISRKEYETINWLSIKERFNQYINSIVFKYLIKQCPNFFNNFSFFFSQCPNLSILTGSK